MVTFAWLQERGSVMSFASEPTVAPSPTESSIDTGVNTINSSSADWVSKATTIKELVAEADLIVWGRVVEAPVTRILRNEAPISDANGNITGSMINEALFSDTVFEVLKVYSGKAPAKILVMQTGGFNAATGIRDEMMDDPLYEIGKEYILFLVDISEDPIQSAGRQLYRTINPAGRYGIGDGKAHAYGAYGAYIDDVLPSPKIVDLEAQIREAVEARQTPK